MNTLRYLKTVELQMELAQFYASDAAKAIFGDRTAGPQGPGRRECSPQGRGGAHAHLRPLHPADALALLLVRREALEGVHRRPAP